MRLTLVDGREAEISFRYDRLVRRLYIDGTFNDFVATPYPATPNSPIERDVEVVRTSVYLFELVKPVGSQQIRKRIAGARATCSHLDRFTKEEGRKIAIQRLLGIVGVVGDKRDKARIAHAYFGRARGKRAK